MAGISAAEQQEKPRAEGSGSPIRVSAAQGLLDMQCRSSSRCWGSHFYPASLPAAGPQGGYSLSPRPSTVTVECTIHSHPKLHFEKNTLADGTSPRLAAWFCTPATVVSERYCPSFTWPQGRKVSRAQAASGWGIVLRFNLVIQQRLALQEHLHARLAGHVIRTSL